MKNKNIIEMKKKTQLTIAKLGIVLTVLMFLTMVVEAASPNFLPEIPGWLSALSTLMCACLPMLFCSVLGSKVPTYKTEDWSSSTPNGVGIIAIGSTILMTVVTVPVAFFPISIKHRPEAPVMYGLVALTLLATIIVEWISLRRWSLEFRNELYPKMK